MVVAAHWFLADVGGVAVVFGQAAVGLKGKVINACVGHTGINRASVVGIVAVGIGFAAEGRRNCLIVALVVGFAGDLEAGSYCVTIRGSEAAPDLVNQVVHTLVVDAVVNGALGVIVVAVVV